VENEGDLKRTRAGWQSAFYFWKGKRKEERLWSVRRVVSGVACVGRRWLVAEGRFV